MVASYGFLASVSSGRTMNSVTIHRLTGARGNALNFIGARKTAVTAVSNDDSLVWKNDDTTIIERS